MALLSPILGLAALALAATAALANPQLRSPIVVESADLTLGDIFVDAGEAAHVRVGPAPQPGERTILRPEELARFARRHGLVWTPGPAVNVVVIRRASTTVEAEDVMGVLREGLRGEGLGGRFAIDIRGRNLGLEVPSGSPYALEIAHLSYEESSGRFRATVTASGPEFAPQQVSVAGTAHSIVEIPVLSRRIARGEVVSEGDVTWIEVRAEDIGRLTATDSAQVVGQEARRLIRPDTPIRLNDLWPPRLVRKGSLVTMTVQTRNMVLQTTGQALEDGARGDVVRVLNTKSRQTVQGVVVADNEILVPLGGGLEIAGR